MTHSLRGYRSAHKSLNSNKFQSKDLSLSNSYNITAAGCDAARRLPPSTIVANIIDLAVAHADSLGVGFAALEPHGIMWVMGRISIEVTKWPRMFDSYELTTWVEGINRLFSERDFELRVNGATAGYARTIWSALDMTTRRSASLAPVMQALSDAAMPSRPCPIDKGQRPVVPANPRSVRQFTFGLSDLDFNRHVTTTRYVDLIMDTVPLDLYDRSALSRLDIAFHREARYADSVEILSTIIPGDTTVIEAAITEPGNPSAAYCAARLAFASSENI